MTKCTSCRVRHLKCDQSPTCSECENAGRKCVRGYNIRFRHLAFDGTSKNATRADYSKHEFFFDEEQTWVDANEKVEFVPESDDYSSDSVAGEMTGNIFEGFISDVEGQHAVTATYHTTSNTPAAFNADSPDYMTSSGGRLQKSPPIGSSQKESDPLTYPLVDESLSGETLRPDSRVSYPQTPSVAPQLAWPLKNLHEGKLLQHFVTFLAPWVCTNSIPSLWILTDSIQSLTLAIVRGTLAKLQSVWQLLALCL